MGERPRAGTGAQGQAHGRTAWMAAGLGLLDAAGLPLDKFEALPGVSTISIIIGSTVNNSEI